jgi:hypothetical protein
MRHPRIQATDPTRDDQKKLIRIDTSIVDNMFKPHHLPSRRCARRLHGLPVGGSDRQCIHVQLQVRFLWPPTTSTTRNQLTDPLSSPGSKCRCDAVGLLPNIAIGHTTDCFPITSEIVALGLTGYLAGDVGRDWYTSCNVYSDGNCQNQVQSVGVHSGQTWGCTALKQTDGSIRCSFG